MNKNKHKSWSLREMPLASARLSTWGRRENWSVANGRRHSLECLGLFLFFSFHFSSSFFNRKIADPCGWVVGSTENPQT